MQFASVVLLSCLLCAVGIHAAETVTLDSLRLEVEPLAADDFTGGLENWAIEGNSKVFVENSRLRIDTPEKGYATVWYKEPFEGNHLIRFRARVLPPRHASNINFFFCASLPDDGDFFAQQRTGAYNEYHEINNYTMTFTGRRDDRREDGTLAAPGYMRLRKNPGFNMVDENLAFKAEVETDYDIAIFKVGNRIKVFVNEVPALDWWDMSETGLDMAHSGGYAGFRTFWSRLEIDDFEVHQVKSWSMAGIEKLKDLCLETDLSQARIVIGSAPSHKDAAEKIAEAIEDKCGQAPAIVADTEIIGSVPGQEPLLVIGNLADNVVMRKLYFEWYTLVDRRFPGASGYLLQTIHNPYGSGNNIVVVGASDDTGLAAAAEKFLQHIGDGAKIGRIYDVLPSEDYAKLKDWDQERGGERLVIPAGFPLKYGLANYGSRDDAQLTACVYLLTGDESRAEIYRQQMLKWVDKGIIHHLYIPSWMIIWDLMEEHPVFSDEDRLMITNWFLTQLRSGQCIGALHVQRTHAGMPHHNHGTRPAQGSFFLARYFKNQYRLRECEVYLNRIACYFDTQADWSKPYCDSSGHQWSATLENKAIYALASGNERFFTSGAARQAAERALRTTNNVGMIPTIGDASYGAAASGLLSKAAFYYQDGRYLWPMSVRLDDAPTDSVGWDDELARGFAGDVGMAEPTDIIGLSVVRHDKGYWEGWRTLRSRKNFSPPNVSYEKAFDKIAFRTGLRPEDELLLLDGVVNNSHDYDDTNTIHEYSRNGRAYLVTCDGLFGSTMAYHNGVNIIRDALSTDIPYCAELIHAAELSPVMVTQTRLNDFSDADWTRTIVLVPDRCFVVIDRMQAREAGTFTFTGHWTTLGEPEMSGDTLTVSQWPRREEQSGENTTYFHMQAPGHLVTHERLAYLRHGRGVRYYPYAEPKPNMMAQSKTSALNEGESGFLYALGHETNDSPDAAFVLHEVAAGVVRVAGEQYAAYAGAAVKAVKIGVVEVDADVFYLDADTVSVAGGRRVAVGDTVILQALEPVTASIDLSTGKVVAGQAEGAKLAALGDEAHASLRQQLLSDGMDKKAEAASVAETGAPLEQLWEFDAGGQVTYLRPYLGNPGAEVRNEDKQPLPAELGVVAVPSAAGHVSFLGADGEEVKRIDVGVRVYDVAVDDIDRDGSYEILIARQGAPQLQCLNADGEERFAFTPEQERIVNSQLQITRHPGVYVFVAERDPNSDKTICVATGDQRLHGLNPAGERQWIFWSYAGVWTRHGLYDLEGDGVKEIVGGNGELSASATLYFLNGRDTYVKRVFAEGWGSTLSSMVIGDINGDGLDEIVAGTSRTSLRAIEPSRVGHLEGYLWSHKLGDDVRGVEIITGADGQPLVVAGAMSEFISAFNGAGEKQWATAVGAPVRFTTTVRSGDEAMIVAALKDGTVVVLSKSGQAAHNIKLPSPPTALAVAGERHDLILVAGEDGVVRALAIPEG